MIRKKIILILLFLFLSLSAVSAGDNATGNTTLADFNEDVAINEAEDSLSIASYEDDINETSTANSNDNPVKQVSKFSAKDVTSKYGAATRFSVKLLDNLGEPLPYKTVTFKVGGKTYNANSDSKGIATVSF